MSDDPTEPFRTICDTAVELLAELRSIHGELAEHPEPGGAAEQRLHQALSRREELTKVLGATLMTALAKGLQVTVEAPGEPGEPPPPPPPSVEESPAPAEVREPAPPEALVHLSRRGIIPTWVHDGAARPERARLVALAEEVGPPEAVTSLDVARLLAHRLVDAVAQLEAWNGHHKRDQQAMLGLVSSLARHLQDESGVGLPSHEESLLSRSFSRMSAWSREHRPGSVGGLGRSNTPTSGSWLGDARRWWNLLVGEEPPEPSRTPDDAFDRLQVAIGDGMADDEVLAKLVREVVDAGMSQSDPRLVQLLVPCQERLHGAWGLKTLKTQLGNAVHTPDDEDDEDVRVAVPADWPLRAFTAGKRAVIIGGDPRPQSAFRIAEAFGFAQVKWEETDVRRVRGLADRVRGGNVDLVIALRQFLAHRDADIVQPACKEVGVPYCLVEAGYGVSRVRMAVERYCSDLADVTAWQE